MSAHERERLSGYLDDELSPEERAEVEAHLTSCEECGSLLAEMGAVDELAREQPLEAPSGYFESLPGRVRGRIEAEGPARARTTRPRPRWSMPAWTWAAAAALVLAVVTPLTLRQLSSQMPASPVAPGKGTPSTAPLDNEAGRVDAPSTAIVDPAEASDDRPGPAAPKASEGARARRPRAQAPELSFVPPPPQAPARDIGLESGPAEAPAVLAPPPAQNRPLEPRLEKDTRLYEATDVAVGEGESLEETFGQSEAAPRQAAVAGARTAPVATPTLGEATAPMAMKADPQALALESRVEGRSAEKKTLLAVDTDAYVRLAHEEPADADGWRKHREAWRVFVESHPDSSRVDEARVRAIEAGLEAWGLGGDPADLDRARSDAEAYLARDDAQQKERVRRALLAASRR